MKKGFFRDIFRGTYLGILSISLLGFLISLRLLNWNPRLWENVANVSGVMIFTIFLYLVLGIVIGILFSTCVKIFLTIIKRDSQPVGYASSWLLFYAIMNTVILVLLSFNRTRPDAHVLIYDIPLVIFYWLTLNLLFILIYRGIKRSEKGVVKASLVPLLTYFIIGLTGTYIFTPKSQSASMGDPAEIAEALAEANDSIKVFVFGVDGAEWSIVDWLVEEGKMPVMEKLIDEGARASLKSLNTLKSPLIWTSMATGKTPEKHGIEDFGCFQFPIMKTSFIKYPDGLGFYRLISTIIPKADMPVNSTIRRVEAIWNILSMADKSVVVSGWWGTWPAETVNGYMISDRFTYSLFNPRATAATLKTGVTYPEEVLESIMEFARMPDDMTEKEITRFIPNFFDQNLSSWIDVERVEWNPLYQLKTGYTAGESYLNAAMKLSDIEQPDFLTVYQEGNDMISHFFWEYMDDSVYPDPISDQDKILYGEVVPRYYAYWDSVLGAVIEKLDPNTNILVVSDHGFGPDPTPFIEYRGGEHLPYGVFLASGPQFKKAYSSKEMSVLDLTPTMLYLYGLPTADDMDGEVNRDIFTEEFRRKNALTYITSYETGRRSRTGSTASVVDDAIKDQLKSLGYVR